MCSLRVLIHISFFMNAIRYEYLNARVSRRNLRNELNFISLLVEVVWSLIPGPHAIVFVDGNVS